MMKDTNQLPVIYTGDCGREGEVATYRCRGVIVDRTAIRTTAVTIDLVEDHLDLAALGDLRQGLARLAHDGGGPGLDVVVTTGKSLAHGVGSGALEPRRVLLEGVPTGSVAGGGGVDAQGHALATCIAGRPHDGSVAGHERGEEGEEDGRGESLGRHDDGFYWVCCCGRFDDNILIIKVAD